MTPRGDSYLEVAVLLGGSTFRIYRIDVRPEPLVLTFLGALLGACGGAPARPTGPGTVDDTSSGGGELAGEDLYAPSYGKPELEQALASERSAVTAAEAALAKLADSGGTDDEVRVATADLAVRRRYVAALEACRDAGRSCPPRLDEPSWAYDPDPDTPGATAPPIDAPLAFDLAGWRAITSELFGRACACRTIACVDSMTVAIDVLEARPAPDVDGDEAAAQSVTRARACLFRLRGRAH
jgi:hypothetical protein